MPSFDAFARQQRMVAELHDDRWVTQIFKD